MASKTAARAQTEIEDETVAPADIERMAGEYLFKFQFFIHECILLKDFFNLAKPAIAIRFLDFPTLIIEGKQKHIKSHSKVKFCPRARSALDKARNVTSRCIVTNFREHCSTSLSLSCS